VEKNFMAQAEVISKITEKYGKVPIGISTWRIQKQSLRVPACDNIKEFFV
jgi:hypothetical protein